jgi:hypothetical protein
MYNSSDGAVLLQQSASTPPTHLVVVNFDENLRDRLDQMAAFLPAVGVTILHVSGSDAATVRLGEINEAQLVRMLPDLASFDLDDPYTWAAGIYRYHRAAMLHALRRAVQDWSEKTHNERTCMLFVGAPRTPLDAVLLGEFPLDAQAFFQRRSGALPLVLRFLVAPRRPFATEDDLPLARLLASLEQIYFDLPSYPPPHEPQGDSETAHAGPFDTTVWVDGEDGGELIPFLRDLLRLHGDENASLAGAAAPGGAGIVPTLEAAMRADADRRLVDWLALCAPHLTPRLWTNGLPALMAVLDMRHDKRRARDPFANIGRYEREADWASNLVVQTYLSQLEALRAPQEDLPQSDFPYRITEDDRASKLEMARRLSDLGEFERAAVLAEDLLEDEPNHRVLNRMLGTDLFVAGHRERARAVLRRCIELTEIDPRLDEARRADEIATLHHLLSEYDAAISSYERAIEADPTNVHAYQGLVFIHRTRGEESLADFWISAARRRGLSLPLVETDDRIEEEFAGLQPPADAADDPSSQHERRSRWWSFLRG